MAKRIIPSQFKTQLINSFIESANTQDVYYAFVGDHVTSGSTDEDVATPVESARARPQSADATGLRIDPFRSMIFGKQIQQSNLKLMARRYDWEQDVVYTRYDDVNANLFNEAFFVAVDEDDDIHIYKCLDNNNQSPSTARPTIDLVINNPDYIETDDGYVWKYMYSIFNTVFRKFATEKFIPVIDSINSDVDGDALIRPGSIDVVAIDFAGQFYNNYIEGQLQADDLVGDNPLEFRLPSQAATAKGFYANTWMYLDDNSKPAGGQFRRVVDSGVKPGTSRVFVTLEDGFSIEPEPETSFKISPIVDIFGDGTETIRAASRAVINSTASNSIHRVEIMENGRDYSFAIASVRQGVSANSTGGSAGVLIDPIAGRVRPILPPPGGHASNPAEELGAKALMIQMQFANSENGTVPTENTFAQFGVIKNPQFSNVEINHVKKSDPELSGSDGDFAVSEEFIQFRKIRLCGNTNLTTEAPNKLTVRANDAPGVESPGYNRFLNVGDLIYLNNDNSELNNFIARITSLPNGFQINMESLNGGIPNWEDDEGVFETRIHIALKISEGIIRDIPVAGRFFAENVTRKLIRNELIIGKESTAIARIESVNISNRPGANGMYDFFTFIQAVRCEGQVPGDDFFNDQKVFQGESFERATMRAVVHSFTRPAEGEDGLPTLLLTNVEGTIDTASAINGLENSATMGPSSGAESTINKYEGDLDPTTGSIIYLQNDVPIERDPTSTEQVRVILEF